MRNLILHLADPHIGARVAKKLEQLNPQLYAEFQSYRDDILAPIADWVISPESQVGLVLIAGDLFDSHEPPEHVVQRACNALARMCAEVPVVTVPGNHDEYSYPTCVYHQRKWPGKLATSPEPTEVWSGELEGGLRISVAAATYQAGKTKPGAEVKFPPATESQQCVAVIHGTEATHISGRILEGERCFKVNHRQVADAGYRYLALGHIHQPREWTIGNCTAVYPGPPIGPSPFDKGSGKLTLVELQESDVRLHRVCDPVLVGWRWHVEEIEVHPGESPEDVATRAIDTLPGDDHCLCAIQLSGYVDREDFAGLLETNLLERGKTVLVASRNIAFSPPHSLELLLREQTLAGEFVREWQRWKTEESVDEAEADLVLHEGFSALDGG